MRQPSFGYQGGSKAILETHKLSSWNRPTLGWKLECEESIDKSRFEGYTAAGTDLEIDKSVYAYSKIGWMFVIVMGIGFAGQIFLYFFTP